MQLVKRVSHVLLIIFYVIAGINHFLHPNGYIQIIPHWLPAPSVLNILAGAAEIAAGLLVLYNPTHKAGCILIIFMLTAFLPVHIDMIIHAPLKVGSLIVTPLLAWIRILLQPVLMLWAWWDTAP